MKKEEFEWSRESRLDTFAKSCVSLASIRYILDEGDMFAVGIVVVVYLICFFYKEKMPRVVVVKKRMVKSLKGMVEMAHFYPKDVVEDVAMEVRDEIVAMFDSVGVSSTRAWVLFQKSFDLKKEELEEMVKFNKYERYYKTKKEVLKARTKGDKEI